VEILKALYRDARVLILDEPTAVLARPEAQRLFETLRGMTGQGLSIIFISHKLNEVMAASDRVAVLRGGRKVAERATPETSPEELAELMVGRRVTRPKREAQVIGAPRLVADRVTVELDGKPSLQDVSFTVHAGEILGIVGVSGNGQAALGALLSGHCRAVAGAADAAKTVRSVGLGQGHSSPKGSGASPRIAMQRAWWASCRSGKTACWSGWPRPEFSTRGFVRRAAAQAHAADLIERFDVRGADPETRIRLLSGGNMQKLILGPRAGCSAQGDPRQSTDAGPRRRGHRRRPCGASGGTGEGVLRSS
jgi:ABC-type uncharacterized transport system ATPase subunit